MIRKTLVLVRGVVVATVSVGKSLIALKQLSSKISNFSCGKNWVQHSSRQDEIMTNKNTKCCLLVKKAGCRGIYS